MNYTPKIAVCSILLLMAIILTTNSDAQSTKSSPPETISSDANQVWKTLVAIEAAVYEHHLSPPTRQQMYLAATQAVYRSNRFSIQSELPSQFSEITEQSEFGELFLAAWTAAEEKGNFLKERTMTAAATAMLQSAGGTGSRFLSAKEFKVTNSLKENQYVGIGIQIGMKDNLPIIHKAFYGGAAHLAGAKSNDLIVEIDGETTQGRNLDSIIDDLRGPQNTTLDVTLKNLDGGSARKYSMTRTVIPIPTIEGVSRLKDGKWKLHLDAEPEIATLKFKSIQGSTANELSQLMRQIARENFKKIILDFSEISLADVHPTIMLADSLLDSQNLGTISSRSEGKSEPTTRPGSLIPDETHIVVLTPSQVNGAVFLLLANLKNHPNVTFVGNKVTSSGLATRTVELAGGFGAVEDLPFALCVSPLSEPLEMEHLRLPNEQSYIWQLRFQVSADAGMKTPAKNLYQKAVEILNDTTNVSSR